MNPQRVSGESLAETEPHMGGGSWRRRRRVCLCARGAAWDRVRPSEVRKEGTDKSV